MKKYEQNKQINLSVRNHDLC